MGIAPHTNIFNLFPYHNDLSCQTENGFHDILPFKKCCESWPATVTKGADKTYLPLKAYQLKAYQYIISFDIES